MQPVKFNLAVEALAEAKCVFFCISVCTDVYFLPFLEFICCRVYVLISTDVCAYGLYFLDQANMSIK